MVAARRPQGKPPRAILIAFIFRSAENEITRVVAPGRACTEHQNYVLMARLTEIMGCGRRAGNSDRRDSGLAPIRARRAGLRALCMACAGRLREYYRTNCNSFKSYCACNCGEQNRYQRIAAPARTSARGPLTLPWGRRYEIDLEGVEATGVELPVSSGLRVNFYSGCALLNRPRACALGPC